jgi:hypothetical protein
MQSLITSPAERNRQAAATNLAVRHLVDRSAKHIHGRQVDGKLAWLVESQTTCGKFYTVLLSLNGWESNSCDCEDAAYRRQECKHIRAAMILATPIAQPAPVPVQPTVQEWQPTGGWSSDNRRKAGRIERIEEV